MRSRRRSSWRSKRAAAAERPGYNGAALCAVVLLAAALAGCADDARTESGSATASRGSATTAEGTTYPVRLRNCGYELVVEGPPQRAVSVNQGSTTTAPRKGRRPKEQHDGAGDQLGP